MKIRKIQIKNFKVFQHLNIDFDDSNLIVFDGPNGFGKTSIYDAIELLFTGAIRRYVTLEPLVVDRRENYMEHPFLCDYADGNLSITIEFSKNGKDYILCREAERESLTNKISFEIYKLYTKEYFDGEQKVLIVDEENYLNQLLGSNYKRNFHFLNYIEQEDSLFLLKEKDKNRKDNISHLFNVVEFDKKLEKLEVLIKKVKELSNPTKRAEIASLKESIENSEAFLKKEFKNTEYLRLFPEKLYTWDTEDFDFQQYEFENLFGEDGIMTKLKKLVEKKIDFKNYIKNLRITKLISNQKSINNFLVYFHFLDRKKELLVNKKEIEDYENMVKTLTNLSIDNIKNELFIIELDGFNFIEDSLKVKFKIDFNSIQSDLKELNDLEGIYLKIRESREKLIESISKLKDDQNSKDSGTCFLCGFDWINIDTLLININKQTLSLEELTSLKNQVLSEKFKEFTQWILQTLIPIFSQKLKQNKLDIKFIARLDLLDEVSINKMKSEFEKISFNYSQYLNRDINSSVVIDFDNVIRPQLEAIKSDISPHAIEPYFKDIVANYFDNSFELLDALSMESILKKEDFLKYKYSILQNEIIKGKKMDLSKKEIKLNKAREFEVRLLKLKDIYAESLSTYQKKVIKDIEIIFHIYSGRIMQDFQGGLGLFIFSDKEGIRFQTSPIKTFDAIFSMSSGQLSALIISFTLALHKKYSQNKIILIDDPVQTMDELNIVGFIELLRNEFYSNQIIVSTHEDMASAFMRYKFKSYGLSQKRINLKGMS
ncbi:AAA family ATPase [Myroides sp. LJL119]